VGGRSMSSCSEFAYRKRWNCRRNAAIGVEQIQARRILDSSGAKVLERASLPARVSALALRDELPASASSQRRPRKDRHLFHARLQSGVDVSRWILVDRSS